MELCIRSGVEMPGVGFPRDFQLRFCPFDAQFDAGGDVRTTRQMQAHALQFRFDYFDNLLTWARFKTAIA
jgi:hypothetical protein